MQQRRQFTQHSRDPSGMKQLLDQVLAGRADVHDDRGAGRDLMKALERQRDAGAARQGEHVDHSVGRSADRREHRDRVVESLGGEDLDRLRPGAGERHRAPTDRLGHLVLGFRSCLRRMAIGCFRSAVRRGLACVLHLLGGRHLPLATARGPLETQPATPPRC